MALPVPPPPPAVAAAPVTLAPPAPAPVEMSVAMTATPAPVETPMPMPVAPAPAPAPVEMSMPAAPAPAPVVMPAAPMVVAAPAPAPMDMSQAVPGGGALAQQFADEGFEGLDFGFGSLPVVSLDQGMFKSSDGSNLGEEFWAMLKQSRPKFLFKTSLPQNDARSALLYTYDGLTDVKGESVQAKLEAWARQGIGYEKKQYLEVVAQLANQDTVLLSIPPTSVRRLSGVLANLRNRGKVISDTWIKVHKGAKVMNVPQPFIPWGFSVQEEAETTGR